jgi:alpha-D-xyloside xylohydrolase
MTSIWPILLKGGEDHREFEERSQLLGNGGNYNAFDPSARELYWEQTQRGLFRHGVDAWWCDCTEPFEADWKGRVQPEPEDRRKLNLDEFHKYLDPAEANLYSSVHSQGIYAHQRAVTERKRVVNLTRSSYPGQQRWSTIAWSGDFSATWEEFRRQIPAAQNFCATGMPWWTFDIGAFFVSRRPELWFWAGDYDRGVADPQYRELYLRMFQFGAFLPVFRSHGTDTPREPWRFGNPGDPVYDNLVRFLKLRERLIPWIYSQAADVCLGTRNLVRPVAFGYPEDPATHNLKDQYLFGDGILVCPVVQPLAAEGPRRRVYLPAGLWYDFWTGEPLRGGSVMEARSGLDRIPVYVKAGTILVLDCPAELRVYPGTDGRLDLYEDAGDGYAYEGGEFSRTAVSWRDRSKTLTLEGRRGSYPGMVSIKNYQCSGPDGTVWSSLDYNGSLTSASV